MDRTVRERERVEISVLSTILYGLARYYAEGEIMYITFGFSTDTFTREYTMQGGNYKFEYSESESLPIAKQMLLLG